MSRRILIVEDEDAVVRTLQVALGVNGYQTVSASTGHLALGEVGMREPNLILLDLYLRGGMNGADFLNEYRARGGTAPVIVISGATRSDPMARDIRVDEFIGKPFDMEHLLQSVRRFAYA
jgi:two-component system OmpR family response regulator